MGSEELQRLLETHSYAGEAEEVVALSIGIHKASKSLDGKTFRSIRDQSDINDKVFSKLKVIGKRLSELDKSDRKVVVRSLPDSYSTIHCLCSLSKVEILNAVKRKFISRDLSIRAAKDYVRKVRFPSLVAEMQPNQEKVEIFKIYRDKDSEITSDAFTRFSESLKKLCGEYGLTAATPDESAVSSLIKQERAVREVFWRKTLASELTEDWFSKTGKEVRKQFNLKSVEELYNSSLRQFTGFLIRSSGGREAFWERFGKAYVSKLHMEQDRTDDRTQRHNWKKRLEEVFADLSKDGKSLAKWNNQILRESGFYAYY